MDNVIGYKDTAEERRINWFLMRSWRESKKVLSSTDEFEKKILDRDLTNYNKFLSKYVDKEAA